MTVPKCDVLIDGKPRNVELTRNGDGSFTAKIGSTPHKIELDSRGLDREKTFTVKLDGKIYKVQIPKIEQDKTFPVTVEEATFQAQLPTTVRKQPATPTQPVISAPTRRLAINRQVAEGSVTAPMTGKIVSVRVKEGESVKEKQVLCIIEAMKMENEITSPRAGTVEEVLVSEGSPVSEGDVLIVIG